MITNINLMRNDCVCIFYTKSSTLLKQQQQLRARMVFNHKYSSCLDRQHVPAISPCLPEQIMYLRDQKEREILIIHQNQNQNKNYSSTCKKKVLSPFCNYY